MNEPTYHVFPTPEAVATTAARLLVGEMQDALKARQACYVLLSGGTTPKLLYSKLREVGPRIAPLCRKAHYFIGDERTVARDHADSNTGQAEREFLDPLEIPAENRHFPDGAAEDLEEECDWITRDLRQLLPRNGDGNPMFDIEFLGVGADGHTASLFPGTEALKDPTPRYALNEVPTMNTRRITLTLPVLGAARHAILLVTGEAKAALISEILSLTPRAKKYPVEELAPLRQTWLLDEAAASRLSPEQRTRHLTPLEKAK